MKYILDGYNITKQVETLNSKELKYQRDWLIKMLIEDKPQGSYKNKVVVVFDGKYEIGAQKHLEYKNYNIEVLFTSHSLADEEIKNLVRLDKNKKDIIVVSNDKDLRRYVSYYGAKVLSVQEFLNRVKKLKQKPSSFHKYKQEISYKDIEKINKEIRKYYGIDENNKK